MSTTNFKSLAHPAESIPLGRLQGPVHPEFIRAEVLADLFEASADRCPEKVALRAGDRGVTYAQLNNLADWAASRLIQSGVRPGHLVGLCLPRGVELLVMQLAIAKTGAGWLPLDSETPPDRIKTCLNDASAFGIVSSSAHLPRLNGLSISIWLAEQLLEPATESEVLRRRQGAMPHHPAYVIYTSGSTGKPKGICIQQGSICHFLRSENSQLEVSESDTVYQGFSVAFDMSFEEIWISYLVGATLWLPPQEITMDPLALPQALTEAQVTVLHAVPTLLALFNQDVPSLRIINLGGEMCPEALVSRWSRPGRKIFNTYGPTEATVSASLAELHAGEPVTIGSPLPNYGLLMVATDVEQGLRLLPPGETGELCITGPGIAAGYLGRPDLTAEKFLANPWQSGPHDARLYRTGDLARIDEQGRVQCLGRTDDQVKIRGFRVELGEIEAVLVQQAGVGAVAVLLRQEQGIDQLVAFIVPQEGHDCQVRLLRAALSERLQPYMVPGRFEILSEMPRLTSGKIDRKALKARPLEACPLAEASEGPETPTEAALLKALAPLFSGQIIQRDFDFFSDLGGHSLLAARWVSALRQVPGLAHATVRDVYQHRTIQAIAAALQSSEPDNRPSLSLQDQPVPGVWRRWRCGLAQAAMLPPLIALRMAQWLAPFFTYHFLTGNPGDSIFYAITLSVLVFLLVTVLEFGIAIVGKWLIAGRLKPGRYPLWGLTYFRWWLSDRLIEAAPVYFISGSSLHAWWLRSLGAKIGQDTHIGSITLRAHDLLSVGDGVSIGNAVNIENARVFQGELYLGRVEIASQANVGSYAVIEGHTKIGEWGHLEAQSALRDGQQVPPRRICSGSPLRDVGAFDPASLPPRPPVGRWQLFGEALFFVFGALLVATLFFLPVFPTFMLIDQLDDPALWPWLEENDSTVVQLLQYFVLALPAAALMTVCTALLSAAIRWSIVPRMRPGTWPIHSLFYCGKWFVNQIQEASLHVLHGVYATVYSPFWYRLLGAKVGRDTEISTALGLVPDMLTLGEGAFIADAVLLGDEAIDGGWLTLQPTHIGNRSFVGNGAYIPDGTRLPENVLIGVMSRPPEQGKVQSGDTWLGSPPIRLPARETLQGYPESLTFRPSFYRRLVRGLIEAFRIVAPHALVISAGYGIVLAAMPAASSERWWDVAAQLALDGMLFGGACFVFVALFKWVLIGRYTQRATPMWTPFVWLSEAATNMYEGLVVPNFMRYLRGTPWLPLAFNLLGCRIGRGVYMDTTDITEFDCVSIGDDSEINALVCPQTHLFEDRIMKIDHVHIGQKVNIGPRSIVLYGAQVGDGAQLGPMTLIMKGERIPEASGWAGNPAEPF